MFHIIFKLNTIILKSKYSADDIQQPAVTAAPYCDEHYKFDVSPFLQYFNENIQKYKIFRELYFVTHLTLGLDQLP